jgi:uncharacterized protein (TIGR03067 family)
MATRLPSRPNLDHLRKQAKTLLAALERGDAAAVKTFVAHLPAAKRMTPSQVKKAGFRLADAQSTIARKTGFASWPALARHVEHLRGLEGEWHFGSLEVDGAKMPAGAFAASRLLIDGDRFRMESAEATYDGLFTIDVEAKPARIDIEFVEGPEAGEHSYGIYDIDGASLTLCLGLVGSDRPAGFKTSKGSGHALERLRRVGAATPAGVTGGTRSSKSNPNKTNAAAPVVDEPTFNVMNDTIRRLQGEWTPLELVQNGEAMRSDWLAFGQRIGTGTETKVVFGGQTMVHAKVRVDEGSRPMSIDYLYLAGRGKGQVSLGLLDWDGDEARFVMATPGEPRPADFTCATGSQRTLSRWRRAGGTTMPRHGTERGSE